jgi:glycosyltransferase involved in cell wall biosynthesis
MASEPKVKVLSLNVYILGHITYQKTLEESFQAIPEVEFRSLHLTDFYKTDVLSKIAHRTLAQPLPGSGTDSLLFDYDFHALRHALVGSWSARRYLNQHLKVYQPDVLHIHTQSIALLSRSLLRRFPSVISIDLTSAAVKDEYPLTAHLTYPPLKALEQDCFQAAAHIATWCDWARQSAIDDYQIPANRVTTVYPGLPLAQFERETVPRSVSTKPRLLFVGNDFVRKGGSDLLAVFLEHFAHTCELDIVTHASIEAPSLPTLRVHRGLRPLAPELLNLYRSADLFVMPTRLDTFPMAFVEAMTFGLPCIGTTVRGVPELVQEGQNGLIVPPGDRPALRQAIQVLVESPERRRAMGARSRQRVAAEFDAVANSRRLAQIFIACASQTDRRRSLTV